MPQLFSDLRINEPTGRFQHIPAWSRTRENSNALRDIEFWLVWRGEGWMRSATALYPLAAGFCCLMRPGGIYDAGQNEKSPLGVSYIHFESSTMELPEFFQLPDPEYFDMVTRRVLALRHQQPETAVALLRGMLLDLVQRPEWKNDEHSFSRDKIHDIIAEIQLSPPDRFPSISELARGAGMSPEHCSRLFRQVSGYSPKEYMLNIRMTHARHMLSESNLSVGEIADRLGYRDLFFFSKQFKAKTGLPPTAFRSLKAGEMTP